AQYLARKRRLPSSDDPLEDLRRGWDDHVEFGLTNQAFYVLMYGSARPRRRPGAADEAHALLLACLGRAARARLLRAPPETAARMALSASVGVTLPLITDAAGSTDHELSARTREAVLAAITTAPERVGAAAGELPPSSLPTLAIALGAALGQDGGHLLSPG